MSGSISRYETAAGPRYRVRYRKPDRSQTDRRGFKTKKEAQIFLASVTVSKATGEYIDPALSRVTIGQLGEAWIASHAVKTKPSTHAAVESAWEVHVRPHWAHTPIGSVTPSDVADWVMKLQAGKAPRSSSDAAPRRPLSASTVLRCHGVLAGILDRAVADRRIPSNPARGVPLPRKKPKQDRHYLSHRQVDLLARAAGRFRILVLVLAYTGVRWGEAVALRAGDVDLVRSRLNIRQNAPTVNGKRVLGTPKTHEARSVPLPAFLVSDIRTLVNGRALDAYLFGDGASPLAPPTHRDGWFAQAKRRARNADESFPLALTLHDLRHTAASLAISAGANVKAVQRMLGHASASMTLDTYADLFDDDLDAVGASLDGARAKALA
jgi:integrase